MSKRLVLFFVFALCISNLAALMLYSSPVKCVRWIEGHITEDAIWTKEDTYRIINNTYVDAGVTLTITPGTQVQFVDNCSLIIEGSLQATGTNAEPIVLTSIRAVREEPDPFPGAWNTTCFKGSENEHFTLKHATVTYATHGLTIEGQGKVTIERNNFSNCSENGIMLGSNDNVVVRDNLIEFNRNGISTQHSLLLHFAAERHSGIVLASNLVCYNQENGIYLYSHGENTYINNVTVSSNVVSFNGRNGIFIHCYGTTKSHLHNLTISSNIALQNRENGIYLFASSRAYVGDLYDISVADNTASSNGKNGIYLHGGFAKVHDITIFNNNASFNGENGIHLRSYQSVEATMEIYDVKIFVNNVSFNNENGIYLYSYAGVYKGIGWAYIRNVTASDNILVANDHIGLYANARTHSPLQFDLLFLNNIISANDYGICVQGGITANLTDNSISYNECGVLFLETKNNLAQFNDIYFNHMGMNVTNGATVNAEENYWGDQMGPFHELLNFEGRGNPINGELTDLDFIPFLTSNQSFINLPPLAVFSANSTNIGIGEAVAFDTSESTDDFDIAYLFFNFGDGTDSGWVTKPIVEHEFTSAGTFNVTLIVMDIFGVRSIDSAIESIHVAGLILPPDFPWTLIIASSILAVVVIVFVVYKVKAKREHHRKTPTDTQRE